MKLLWIACLVAGLAAVARADEPPHWIVDRFIKDTGYATQLEIERLRDQQRQPLAKRVSRPGMDEAKRRLAALEKGEEFQYVALQLNRGLEIGAVSRRGVIAAITGPQEMRVEVDRFDSGQMPVVLKGMATAGRAAGQPIMVDGVWFRSRLPVEEQPQVWERFDVDRVRPHLEQQAKSSGKKKKAGK